MMSTSARAAALMTAALLVGSSATAATAAAGGQVRASTVTAGELVTAGEPVANGAAAAVTMTSNRKPKPAKGFHVVKELPPDVYLGFSPARGELWLATGGGLEHLRAGRWTTETVPVGYGSSFTGTSRDDVWLGGRESLLRYDGHRWTTVALPTFDYSPEPWLPTMAEPWHITAMVSPRKGVLYAAAFGTDGLFGRRSVLRYAKGRWTDLGPPDYYDDTREFEILQMKVVDGALLTHSRIRYEDHFDSYVDGTWWPLYSNSFLVTNFLISGWYPRSFSNHLLLGGGGFAGVFPHCARWIGAQPLIDCTTTRVPAASAQLKNGSIVIAEGEQDRPLDLSDLSQSEHVKANFGLRDVDGRETSLAGDPGDSTHFIVAEAHRNAAWAVTGNDTDTGWKYYLQRYEG